VGNALAWAGIRAQTGRPGLRSIRRSAHTYYIHRRPRCLAALPSADIPVWMVCPINKRGCAARDEAQPRCGSINDACRPAAKHLAGCWIERRWKSHWKSLDGAFSIYMHASTRRGPTLFSPTILALRRDCCRTPPMSYLPCRAGTYLPIHRCAPESGARRRPRA
jgi:hypothetical protein